MHKHWRWMKGVLALLMAMVMITGPGVIARRAVPAAAAETTDSMTQEADLSIVTKYITLSFPAEYAEEMSLIAADTEQGCSIIAFTDIDGAALELYTILLSETAAEGFRLGRLKTAEDTEAGVYLLMNVQDASLWPEDTFEKINRLQESINFLLVQIHENKDFVADG